MISMKEIEVKILEVNREEIEKKLVKLHTKKIFEGKIQTLFLDFKDSEIAKQKNLLRLRKNPQKTELTYKKVKRTQTFKIAEEYTVEVLDPDTLLKILENLGLTVTSTMDKYRLSYKLDNTQFDLDKYTGEYAFIPEFLEIEAESIDKIHQYAKLLGFKAENCLSWSTKELIEHYFERKEKTEKSR